MFELTTINLCLKIVTFTVNKLRLDMTFASVQCYDPRIGNRKSPVKFCGKSQGDIASLLNVPRGMFNQEDRSWGYLQDT